MFVLAGFAVATVVAISRKAAAGIDGQSSRDRRVILAAWLIGYVIVLVLQAALSDSASAQTLAFIALAGPLILAGIVYIMAAVLGRDLPALGLGCWLVIAGVSCAWQAPAAMLATCALAGGGGFLLIALIEIRRRA